MIYTFAAVEETRHFFTFGLEVFLFIIFWGHFYDALWSQSWSDFWMKHKSSLLLVSFWLQIFIILWFPLKFVPFYYMIQDSSLELVQIDLIYCIWNHLPRDNTVFGNKFPISNWVNSIQHSWEKLLGWVMCM